MAAPAPKEVNVGIDRNGLENAFFLFFCAKSAPVETVTKVICVAVELVEWRLTASPTKQ